MYGNLELMKISNFLHLTWDHIKSHCEILKREFCTYLPKNDENFEEILESDLPVEIKTVDYVYDSPTDFDERTNGVTLKVIDAKCRSMFFYCNIFQLYSPSLH